ncbi:hypothetical protein QBC35DRAFT_178199 [Podospora australis]|uniref:Uncharacterized protein n=1 Tax=Podospora australis TaxID=1536484 RepID=A0AAN6WWV1_9PEZI|nr:hypothetical protein QBC35DRAFT_178199 [Podospora australis]
MGYFQTPLLGFGGASILACLFFCILFPIFLNRWRQLSSSTKSGSNGSSHNGYAFLGDEKPRSQRLEAKRRQRMDSFKDMYHKLQNLEDFPDILPEARQMLESLLEKGLRMARYKPLSTNILDIKEFDAVKLQKFMLDRQTVVGHEFEAYVRRREEGGPPELFQSLEEACKFLQNSAPWNYTDGAWLARVHQITTPFSLRSVTKDAWQIFSEELGDGDLEKNHIWLYRDLLQSVGVNLPDGHTKDFIHPRHGMEDEAIWRYAIGQLLVSTFPNDFLPEILGFNLHYEQPAIGVLKANKELPEFGISPYYYALHISIDNADSGHCAMALGNIVHFMEIVRETGMMDSKSAWKRVQAGYCLGQSLDEKETVDDYEDRLVEFLHRKASIAQKIHCTSRARIGKKSLSSWFDPDEGCDTGDDSWKDEFLVALADSKPWVHRGDSGKSALMRELSWKGRMFGAFTHDEVELMRTWIDTLPSKDSGRQELAYWDLVGGFTSVEKAFHPPRRDVAVTHPVFSVTAEWTPSLRSKFVPQPPSQISRLEMDDLMVLWFVHSALLENTISSPHQTMNPLVSHCLQILRAEKGYKPEGTGIACMDEQLRPSHSPDLVSIGLDIFRRHSSTLGEAPTCLGDVLGSPHDDDLGDAARFAHKLLGWAQRPAKNMVFLLGLARAFVDLEVWVAGSDTLLGGREREALRLMIERKLVGLEKCLDELKEDEDRRREFVAGYEIGRAEIEKLFG